MQRSTKGGQLRPRAWLLVRASTSPWRYSDFFDKITDARPEQTNKYTTKTQKSIFPSSIQIEVGRLSPRGAQVNLIDRVY